MAKRVTDNECVCACFEVENEEFPGQCCCGHVEEEHNPTTGTCEAESVREIEADRKKGRGKRGYVVDEVLYAYAASDCTCPPPPSFSFHDARNSECMTNRVKLARAYVRRIAARARKRERKVRRG